MHSPLTLIQWQHRFIAELFGEQIFLLIRFEWVHHLQRLRGGQLRRGLCTWAHMCAHTLTSNNCAAIASALLGVSVAVNAGLFRLVAI